jgi:hypothetical protein
MRRTLLGPRLPLPTFPPRSSTVPGSVQSVSVLDRSIPFDFEASFRRGVRRTMPLLILRQREPQRNLSIALLQKILFYYVLSRYALKTFRHFRARGLLPTAKDAYTSCARYIFSLLLKLPSAKAKVARELSKARLDMIQQIAPAYEGIPKHFTLPQQPRTAEDIGAELEKLANIKASNWQEGRVSGAVYYGDQGSTPCALPLSPFLGLTRLWQRNHESGHDEIRPQQS